MVLRKKWPDLWECAITAYYSTHRSVYKYEIKWPVIRIQSGIIPSVSFTSLISSSGETA